MARARSGGGGNGSIWGLVIFGAGFLVCLILAILFYTKVETAEQGQASAEAALAKVQTSADTNNETYTEVTSDPEIEGRTAVGKLLTHGQSLRSEVSGLQGQVSDLTRKLSAAQTQLEQQKAATTKAQGDYAQALDTKETQSRELNAKVTSLNTTVTGISAENDRLKGLIDTSIQEVANQYQGQITTLREQAAALDRTVNERDRTIKDQQDVIADLGGDRPEAVPVTLADATIISQIPKQNKVYLDIGRNTGLQLGMSFSVFDPDDLVKLEADEEGKEDDAGKAIVEIINMTENTAVGRIVSRTPHAVIRNGDALVNVVFDPDRVFTFHVFGQFDLNKDGKPDDNGTTQVRSMVTRFNGRLAEDMGFATDYLVLGQEPALPSLPDDELDLIKMKQYRVQLENFNAYQQRILEARELGLPVLNQNRFLDLVGFFQR